MNTEEEFQDRYAGAYVDQDNVKWFIEKLNSNLGLIKRDKCPTALQSSYTLKVRSGVLNLMVGEITYAVGFTDMGLNLIHQGVVVYTLFHCSC